ncbi:MAG: hypothetical protein HYV04_20650 [Deltaproteobacteria bacterium]|nr:hypothetical protein [Deltaproteobacteria bacterium]
MAALLAVVLLIRNDLLRRGIQQEPFFVRIHTAMTFGYPGLLVYRYKSKFGDLLAPVGFAVVVEVTNKLSSAARIVDYFVDMKVDDRWVRLPNLQALNGTEFFWINNGNFQTATRLDFRENGLDAQARLLTLQPGESVKGWMFFEWPPELREKAPLTGGLRITLENSHGQRQTLLLSSPKPQEPGGSSLAGGEWHVMPKDYAADLSGLRVLPHIDLLTGFKGG